MIIIKKIQKYLLIILLYFIISIINVKANTINSINMDITINKDGSANVVEIWDAGLQTGTEGYKLLNFKQNEYITDLKVSDDRNIEYERSQFWYNSFEEKANKYYLKKNDRSSYEILWGISKYGRRIYKIEYKINNFVAQYKDSQGVYINLIKQDMPVRSVKVNIHTYFDLSKKNAKIWGFGYKGKDIFYNGSIEMTTNDGLSNEDYMVILIKFKKDMFKTNNKIDFTFGHVLRKAKIGTFSQSFYINLIVIIALLIPFYRVIFVLGFSMVIMYIKKICGVIHRWLKNKILKYDNRIEYYREIPCDNDLMIVFYLCRQYKIVTDYDLKRGIMSACLLKWIKDKNVFVRKLEKEKFSIRDNNYIIDFSKIANESSPKEGVNELINKKDPYFARAFEEEAENDLFRLILSASGIDNILQINEFKKWSKLHPTSFDRWFDQAYTITSKRLTEQKIFFNKSLEEEVKKIKGLKKFLYDFTSISDKTNIEISLWEEYMIYASLFGIADRVEKEFKKLYPDFDNELRDMIYDATEAMTYYSFAGIRSAKRASSISSAFSSVSDSWSRDSGGGGSSYSGGGSSSGGASGGGFR